MEKSSQDSPRPFTAFLQSRIKSRCLDDVEMRDQSWAAVWKPRSINHVHIRENGQNLHFQVYKQACRDRHPSTKNYQHQVDDHIHRH